MPYYWHATYFNHRFGFEVAFLTDTGSVTSGQNNDFHNKNALIIECAKIQKKWHLRLVVVSK